MQGFQYQSRRDSVDMVGNAPACGVKGVQSKPTLLQIVNLHRLTRHLSRESWQILVGRPTVLSPKAGDPSEIWWQIDLESGDLARARTYIHIF